MPTESGIPPPRQPFTRADLARCERVRLGGGRWPKAAVWRVRIGGEDWVVKDFRGRGFLARNLIGANFVRREARALRRLKGVRGVPAEAFRIDRYALAYRFTPGRPLASIPSAEQPPEWFVALERTLRDVHARGIVHLDIRNCRNVIVSERDEPVMLDFESHLDTSRWFRRPRAWLERFDLAGVYKHWQRARPDSLDPERLELLTSMNRWRRAWVFRGLAYYPRAFGKLMRWLRSHGSGGSGTGARP